MKTVTIKYSEIGRGRPKIAVPLVGNNLNELEQEIAAVKKMPADLVEWRVDFFDETGALEAVVNAGLKLRLLLPDHPLLFTFRTEKEGGKRPIAPDQYLALNKKIIGSGIADLIDVEWSAGEEAARTLIEAAHAKAKKVILSSHEFHRTPTEKEIIRRLCRMQELGADITKMAVMPRSSGDVLTLLRASNLMKTDYADRPFITMAMSGKGLISRLTGELFGSAVTFGTAIEPSAPGQIKADQLAELLMLFHRGMSEK